MVINSIQLRCVYLPGGRFELCLKTQMRLLFCRVGIHSSQVEVRFQDLNVETDVFVGSRALPSVSNAFLNYLQVRHCLQCRLGTTIQRARNLAVGK